MRFLRLSAFVFAVVLTVFFCWRLAHAVRGGSMTFYVMDWFFALLAVAAIIWSFRPRRRTAMECGCALLLLTVCTFTVPNGNELRWLLSHPTDGWPLLAIAGLSGTLFIAARVSRPRAAAPPREI